MTKMDFRTYIRLKKRHRELDKIPDPYSDEIYDFIDDNLGKALKKPMWLKRPNWMKLPGKFPRKAKETGKALEAGLYQSLHDNVDTYLDTLTPDMTVGEIIAGVEAVIDGWVKQNTSLINMVVPDLTRAGALAGLYSSGVRDVSGIADESVLQFIASDPKRIGSRITLFSSDIVDKFRDIISEVWTTEGAFSIPELTGMMREVVETQEYKLQRIVRTEVAAISGVGRLLGWSTDPDRGYYEYLWINPQDKKSKPISKRRVQGGPYTFEEAAFLWEHQAEMVDGHIESDVFNQRCSIARYPKDTEFKGNRFAGDSTYIVTTPLPFRY